MSGCQDGELVVYDRVEARADASPDAPLHARLWVSSVAGGAPPERLTNEELHETAGSWSPDGEWYAYFASRPEGGALTLKRVRVTGRAAPETLLENVQWTQVTGSVDPPLPLWSPDGAWLLIANPRMTLLSLDGKPTRDLGIEAAPCAFALAEPLLYCIRGTPLQDDHSLVAIDFDGNPVRTIGPVPLAETPAVVASPGVHLSLTPDGSAVTYSVSRGVESLWLMDGLDEIELP